MVVPGATTSPTSAALTSTTPSTGETATVSLICLSISERFAVERAISAWRVASSSSRRLISVPILLSALHLCGRGIYRGFGIQFLLRPRSIPQFGQAGLGGGHIGAPCLQVCRKRRLLQLHRGLRLGQLRFAGG